MKQIPFILIAIIAGGVLTGVAAAQSDDTICAFYFTGIGCPHCGNVDPVILGDWLQEYPELVVIEFELYQHPENQPVYEYIAEQYNFSSLGIPKVAFAKGITISGDTPILTTVPQILRERETIAPESGVSFVNMDRLNLVGIPGSPQIWHRDRILIRNGTEEGDEIFIKSLLSSENLNDALAGRSYEKIDPVPVNISGGAVEFEYAIGVRGWVLQWNGEPLAEPTPTAAATPTATESPLPAWLAVAAVGAALFGYGKRKP